MDDTLVIPRIELRPARPLTNQFAPERRRAVWPWFVGVALLALTLANPIDPMRAAERLTHAHEILPALPAQ